MQNILPLLSILVLWFVLNRWVLPWLGVPTCMSGGCEGNRCASSSLEPWNHNDQNSLPKGDRK